MNFRTGYVISFKSKIEQIQIDCQMNAKTIALIVALAALTIAANPAISGIGLPFPPIPGLIFNLWEIIIIIAFFLTGFRGGLAVAIINAIFLLTVFPGPSRALYPLTNTIAVLSMMIGIYSVYRIMTHRLNQGEKPSPGKTLFYYTASAMLLRIAVMAPIMYALLCITGVQSAAAAVLTLQAVYNIIQVLYTIPIAYFVARLVNKNFKLSSYLIEQ
jgi:riboflavin transporter FmnP